MLSGCDAGRIATAAVSAELVTKRFGTLPAVDRLSFELASGTVTGFLGPNGAGKTTTLRMLLGLAAPSSRYLPATAANVLTRIETQHQLPVATGVLVFCAYIAVAIAASVALTARRDVP